MAHRGKKARATQEGSVGLGGFLGGLGALLEKLGELAETGEELRKEGEIRGPGGQVRGVYGFNVKVGLGDQGIRVEPFGNLGKDARTGRPVVQEVREPLVDVFDEKDHVLVVAEMPGVAEEDVDVELNDDILTIVAGRGEKKYRKEVLLPESFSPGQMSRLCRNGVLEVKLAKPSPGGPAA
jgi:HSP20 family protein